MDRDRLTALPPLAHTSQRTCLACPTPTDQPYCSAACRRRNNGGVPIIRRRRDPGAPRTVDPAAVDRAVAAVPSDPGRPGAAEGSQHE